jgi:predicted DNA-binding transcriptional regulator AlpA
MHRTGLRQPDGLETGSRSVRTGGVARNEFDVTDGNGVTLEPILLDARGAAKLAGVSRATWYRLHSSGRCPSPVRLGARVLWRLEELREWARAGCPSRARWEEMKERA